MISELYDAIENKDYDKIKLLLCNGTNFDINDIFCRCCSLENLEIIQMLLDSGADIHVLDDKPFKNAFVTGNYDMIKLLISNGVNIHAHKTLFTDAIRKNYTKIVKLFIELGVNINMRSGKPLCLATVLGNLDMVKLLVESGANIHVRDDQALYNAAIHEHCDIVKYLLDNGANIYCHDGRLLKCVINYNSPCQKEIIILLLQYGCPIKNALWDACLSYNFEITKLLLDLGEDINNIDSDCFINLIINNEFQMCQLLLESGFPLEKIPINIKNINILVYCAQKDYYEIFELLLDHDIPMPTEILLNYSTYSDNFQKILVQKGYI